MKFLKYDFMFILFLCFLGALLYYFHIQNRSPYYTPMIINNNTSIQVSNESSFHTNIIHPITNTSFIKNSLCFNVLYTFQRHWFAEAIDSLLHFLERNNINFTTSIIDKAVIDSSSNCWIILIDPCTLLGYGHPKGQFPPFLFQNNTILYNFEPISRGGHGVGAMCINQWNFLSAINGYIEWDFSKENVEYLSSLGLTSTWIPPAFDGDMTTWHLFDLKEIYDVVFFGTNSFRRSNLINSIQRKGVKVQWRGGFGIERDRVLASAKVILNVHFSEVSAFEFLRLVGPLSNKKCIVSESIRDTAIMETFKDAIIWASYDELADAVVNAVKMDPEERNGYGERAYHIYSTVYSPENIFFPVFSSLPSENRVKNTSKYQLE